MAAGCGSRQQAAGMAAKQDPERPALDNKNEAKRTKWNWGEAINIQSPPPVMYFLHLG